MVLGGCLPRKTKRSVRQLITTPAAQRAEAAQLDQLTIRQRLAHELEARKGEIPAVLDALVTKAEKGDVPAARELRGWFDQGLGRPEAASLDTGDVDRPYQDMTPEERTRLRAGVTRRISEAEAALEMASKPRHRPDGHALATGHPSALSRTRCECASRLCRGRSTGERPLRRWVPTPANGRDS